MKFDQPGTACFIFGWFHRQGLFGARLEPTLDRRHCHRLDGAGYLHGPGPCLERACFDCLIIEDGSFIADAYQDSPEWYLRNAFAVPRAIRCRWCRCWVTSPKPGESSPPSPPASIPPISRHAWARQLDHLTHGRVGLNVVTAHNDRSAQNFGLDRHYEHDLRYEMADEWMEVVNRLWASWEPDAIVANLETGVFADHIKIHPIHFEGHFYKSRGPLNTAPGPQRRPVICQAGGSPPEGRSRPSMPTLSSPRPAASRRRRVIVRISHG